MICSQNRSLEALIYGVADWLTGGLVDWSGWEDLNGISYARRSGEGGGYAVTTIWKSTSTNVC